MPSDVARAESGTSDADLVARAARGEAGAFDALFQRHYARVVNLAARLDGNADNAEDIAQTAFLRAHLALGRMRDGQSILKWLYRTVVNLVRDRAKMVRRKPWMAIADLFRPSPDGAEADAEPAILADRSLDPERTVTADLRNEALYRAIAALPADFREVVVLHHLEQMDVADVAETLGVRVGTVKSRLGRARMRLRDAMKDWIES
ncbi:MAG TPA: sigma-70 family RNA polymerase sigma factor [Desulfobacterales bacterium]|nr:sigma-70 family RNA polymerase sigma factor [Desulfobacterales bacterium]